MKNESFGSSEIMRCAIRCFCNERPDAKGRTECNRVYETLEDRLAKSEYKLDQDIIIRTADAIEARQINAEEQSYDQNPIVKLLDHSEVHFTYEPDDDEGMATALGDALKFLEEKLQQDGYYVSRVGRKTLVVEYLDPADNFTKKKTIKTYDLLKKYDAPERLFKILTSLPSKKPKNLYLEISTKPEDILLKSTCQNWTSCENLVEGEFDNGPYSDVKNWNGMAVLREEGVPKEEWYGRQMLRWCVDDKGEMNVGVEPRFYGEQSYSHLAQENLKKLLDEHGLGEFEFCATPYKYGGYSDTSRRSNDIIVYGDVNAHRYKNIEHLVNKFVNEQSNERRLIQCTIKTDRSGTPAMELFYTGTIKEFLENVAPEEHDESYIKDLATLVVRSEIGHTSPDHFARNFVRDGLLDDMILSRIIDHENLPSDNHMRVGNTFVAINVECGVLPKGTESNPWGAMSHMASSVPTKLVSEMDDFWKYMNLGGIYGELNVIETLPMVMDNILRDYGYLYSDDRLREVELSEEKLGTLMDEFVSNVKESYKVSSSYSDYGVPEDYEYDAIESDIVFLTKLGRFANIIIRAQENTSEKLDFLSRMLYKINESFVNGDEVKIIKEVTPALDTAIRLANSRETERVDMMVDAIDKMLYPDNKD